jgi:hypothetical protein
MLSSLACMLLIFRSQEIRERAEEDDEVKDEIGKLITAQCGINNFGCLSNRCCCKCAKFRLQAYDFISVVSHS